MSGDAAVVALLCAAQSDGGAAWRMPVSSNAGEHAQGINAVHLAAVYVLYTCELSHRY